MICLFKIFLFLFNVQGGVNILDTNLACQKFNCEQKAMDFILKSGIRFEILNQLHMSAKNKRELNSITAISYAAICNHIDKLEGCGFVIRGDNNKYGLSDDFKAYFENLLKLNMSVEFIKENSVFLNNHEIFNIDSAALSDISPLYDMELISNDNNDVFKVSGLIQDFLMESKTIKSVFPYVPLNHDEIFAYWMDNGVDVNLILSKELCQSFKDFICEYEFDEEIGGFSLDMKIADPSADVLLVISDKGVLLGFYKNDGDFDGNSIFFSKTEQSREWAEHVFETYEESCGESIRFEELLMKNNADGGD